jgi:hypothetical protein
MAKPVCKLCGEGGGCKCDKDIKVYFCPKCRSTNVRYVFGLGNVFGIIPKQRCLDCGFEMTSFPILVTSKRKLAGTKKKSKKKNGRKKNG